MILWYKRYWVMQDYSNKFLFELIHQKYKSYVVIY